MIRFQQKSRQPLIVSGDVDAGKWFGLSVLNAGAVIFGSQVFLYYRGAVGTDNSYHAIGCMTQPVAGFDPHDRNKWTDRGIVLRPTDVAGVSGAQRRLTDVSAVVFGGRVWIYFNVKDGNPFRVQCANSSDGLAFTDKGPCLAAGVSFGGGGAGVCQVGSALWMMHGNPSVGYGTEIAVRKSIDGVNWTHYVDSVIAPDGGTGFTGFSMVTARLYYEAPYIYAFVPSGAVHADYPEAVGVWRAHENDHATWEAFPRNPVFLRNSCGMQDEAAIWSFNAIQVNGRMHAFYEGAGSRSAAGSAQSNGARDVQYYNYDVDSFSQLFVVDMEGVGTLAAAWDGADEATPLANCYLRNMATLGYLAPLGGATANGTQLAAYLSRSAAGTLWTASLDDGFFRLGQSGKAAEVDGSSRATGHKIAINAIASAPNPQQEWHLVTVGAYRPSGGLYRIQNRRSGMYLSVDKSASGDAALVSQRALDGSPSQIWLLQPVV